MNKVLVALAALLAAACGNDRANPGDAWFVDETVETVTIQEAVRAGLADAAGWEHENVSDHGTARTELMFEPERLVVFVDDYDLFRDEEPQIYLNGEGTWQVDERGVVILNWEDGGLTEERTWAPLGPALAEHLREPDGHDRGSWPSTGYLAQNAQTTVFHHRFWKRDGSTEQGGGDAVLELSASPSALADGAPCSLRIEMEVSNRDAQGAEVFEFDCEVDEDGGFYRIRAVDIPVDDPSLAQWEVELENRGITDAYEYGVYAAFRDAAFPVLWFDPAQPHILVTDGYSDSLSRFEPSDHD